MRDNYPDCLRIKGRKKLLNNEFNEADKLFHAFDNEDLDELYNIRIETIRFPDFSCNWSKFSKPEHIRHRRNGNIKDGCYSFTVKTSRYKKLATPVHDPLNDKDYPNYAHAEVRELLEGEDIFYEPPKGRKKDSKRAKSIRREYRQNISNNLNVELEPK